MSSRKRGSVTVFAALSFLLITSLISVLVESVKIEGSRAMVCAATTMAMDNLFAGYEAELLEDYNVLLLDGGYGEDCVDYEALEKEIMDGIEFVISPDARYIKAVDFYNIEIDDVEINQIVTPLDAGGMIWRKMVTDYEKLEYPAELIEILAGIDKQDSRNRAIMAIVDKIDEGYEKAGLFTQSYLQIIEHMDGIKGDVYGINWSKTEVAGQYVKELSLVPNEQITNDSVSISENRAYNLVVPKTVYIYALLDAVIQESEKISKGKTVNLDELSLQCEAINSYFEKVRNENLICINLINSLQAVADGLNETTSAATALLEAFDFENQYSQGLYEDLMQLREETEKMMHKISSLSPCKPILESNIGLLNEVIDNCPNTNLFDYDLAPTSLALEVKEKYQNVMELIGGYRTDGMYMDYSDLEYEKSSSTVPANLTELVEDKILGMVLPAGATVSNKELTGSGYADMYAVYGNRQQYIEDIALDITNEIIFSLYITDTFESFSDNDGKGLLDYEQEYIIFGERKDSANLIKAIGAIAQIRLAANNAHIFTSSAKKSEAKALSMALVGATGVLPLIKAVEYVILFAWAVGETVIDLKLLLNGDKVVFNKQETDWRLSLDNLLSGNLDMTGAQNERGLTYSRYLACVLMLRDSQKKAYRSMSVVEMNMRAAGVNNFKLKNYIYGMNVTVTYHLGNGRKRYYENCSYTY